MKTYFKNASIFLQVTRICITDAQNYNATIFAQRRLEGMYRITK
jgi:hypothetical protein